MEKKNVVVIDDEEHILELIKYNLETNGFYVETFTSVEEADSYINQNKIDALLLDIMLPGIDGMSALSRFRKNKVTKDIPILMISAKGEELDRILGLELGADDYITKPFSVRELVARVKAIVRRNERNTMVEDMPSQLIDIKGLQINIESHLVSYEDHDIEVTYKEFEILKLLMQSAGKVMTREVILDQVWGYDYYGETRTVDVHIRYLRSKLETFGIGHYIETVRGVGYKFIKE